MTNKPDTIKIASDNCYFWDRHVFLVDKSTEKKCAGQKSLLA